MTLECKDKLASLLVVSLSKNLTGLPSPLPV